MNREPAPKNVTVTIPTNWFAFVALGCVSLVCVVAFGVIAFAFFSGGMKPGASIFPAASATFVAIGTPQTATLTTTATPSPTPSGTPTPPVLTDVPVPLTFEPPSTDQATPEITFEPPPNLTDEPTPQLADTYTALKSDFSTAGCDLFVGDNETRKYSCENGEYVMLHKQNTTRYAYYDQNFDDAVINANGHWVSGEGKHEYGIVFRANTDGTLYYVFTVTEDGRYNVSLYKDGKYTDLIPYTASSYVNQGAAPNDFQVITRGDRFDFYLNGNYLGAVTDDNIASGDAGVFFYNEKPNVTVAFDQVTVSTFSPPTPTSEASVSDTPVPDTTEVAGATTEPTQSSVKPGVYVNNLRLTSAAKRGQPITFAASFVNTTGNAVSFDWIVEVWEQNTNKKNPYGQADGLQQNIPAGTSELATGNSWKVAGGGPCTPFRARVVYQDNQSRRIAFKRSNGSDLWLNFQVCP